jgi:hypothetical protein
VGDILSQVALPADAVVTGFEAPTTIDGMPLGVSSGQTLTSLLRDPALIFKLVILSGLSLLPVLFKVSTAWCFDSFEDLGTWLTIATFHSHVQTQ